ncbi:MAG TPA: DUF2231 domain-containing protein [Myxococcota bacterium]|nr:DUF2231 domain-containing protein [Myxococcota bacterium]
MSRLLSLLVVFCLVVASGLSAAEAKKPKAKAKPQHTRTEGKAKKAVTKSEDVEQVEAVEPAEPEGEGKDAEDKKEGGFFEMVGHLHPAVVHMPIGWLVLLLLLDLAAFLLNRPELLPVGPWVGLGVVLSFIPAAITGLLRFDGLPQDPEAAAPALLHRNVMYGCLVLCIVALVVRVMNRNELEGRNKWIYLGLVASACLTVTIGGHLGGQLVYGNDFLPF